MVSALPVLHVSGLQRPGALLRLRQRQPPWLVHAAGVAPQVGEGPLFHWHSMGTKESVKTDLLQALKKPSQPGVVTSSSWLACDYYRRQFAANHFFSSHTLRFLSISFTVPEQNALIKTQAYLFCRCIAGASKASSTTLGRQW
jgi:hypothetical protein